MARFYTVQFTNVTVAAAQDLIGVLCTANMAIKLWEFRLSADASSAALELRIAIKRTPATATAGSGGTSFTPLPVLSTDAAATFTARCNDTTRQTTSPVVIYSDSINVLNGWQFLPVPEYRPSFKPGEGLVIGMEVAPSSVVFDGCAVIEELF